MNKSEKEALFKFVDNMQDECNAAVKKAGYYINQYRVGNEAYWAECCLKTIEALAQYDRVQDILDVFGLNEEYWSREKTKGVPIRSLVVTTQARMRVLEDLKIGEAAMQAAIRSQYRAEKNVKETR